MPSLESRRRSRARFEEDDDDDDEQEPSPASDSSKPKRQRRAVNDDMSDEEDSSSDNTPRARRSKGLPSINGLNSSAAGEFQPGAIVRVMVRNFVTYEQAEFLPGPNLNLVIGPNGTGKSSLVCAICLGLGYHPKHLGRASRVGEFVKHGNDTATIEIELQKRPHEPKNHVIRVQISKEQDSRKWWLDGKESTHKAVQEVTSELRVQVDNLCQFLPQDKVNEFSRITPVQLLHETLRAAAPKEMVKWQTELKDLHLSYKKVKEQVDTCAETLKGHEARQQGLQADVDRLREREAIQQKVEDLQSARAVAEYNEVRRSYYEARQRIQEAKKRLEELETACGPALEAVNQKKEYKAKIEPFVHVRKRALQDAEAQCDQLLRTIEVQDEKIKDLQTKKLAEENSLKLKKNNVGRLRKVITELEGRQKNKPPDFSNAEWNAKIREQENILRDNERERRELDGQFQELKRINKEKMNEVAEIEQKQRALASQQGQKLASLRRINSDAAKGWEWLQKNQDQFEKEVFGPPMLTCSVTDKRYSDLIQALLSRDDFCCFISQTASDHKKLSDQFYRLMGLSVTIRTCGTPFDSFRPAIPRDQVREMGLDGYAIDYLEGPSPVLAMLCSDKKLHVSGVALRDIDDRQYEQIMNSEHIPSWATGHTMYRAQRRREYGAGAVSTVTRKVGPGRFWTDQPLDNSEKVELEKQKQEIDAELSELKSNGSKLKSRLSTMKEDEERIREEIEKLKRDKNELQKLVTQHAALGDKIAAEKGTLENTQKDIRECRARMLEYSAEEDELTIKKTRSVLEHKEALSNIRDAHQALLEVQIRLLEAQSDVKGLEERNSDIKQRLDDEKAHIAAAKAESERFKADATVARSKVEAAVAHDKDKLSYLNELASGKSVEELDDEIGAEQSKLEYVHAVDPGVLRQFEKRAQDIQNLTRHKDELTEKLEALSRKFQNLMQKWEPRVDELVSKINDAFSYNFEQISCAGEVGLHKDEDFEQWSLIVKVKYRENETLQQLNQHRQSGGERSVATVFYLLALQSMAQAPFRVVDEVNQGMDPRNERMMHERMVEIACHEHTSQYFLITPKLLTGLRYDERMRVLCIASGEYMPAEGKRLDFKRIVQQQQRRRRESGRVGVAAA
ncbi:P-loop containing nucleoside triphosphate hydrolase protein [Biscogniauxia mediterranea]|nr:P-loop containing nucleoside triphosphate hydrolase protein [Biscogniauxia mediterranea]